MAEEKRTCANCKRLINAATFELHESHCVRHIKLCEVCDEPIPIKDMEEHFEENHAPTQCDLCGMSVAVDQLEEHKESSCSEAKLECKYCELDVRRGDYLEHVDQCGSRTDYCELCNQRVMLKEMSEHREMKCGHMKAESPLGQAELRELGLVDVTGNGSQSDNDSYDDNLPVTPPPPYHSSHDNSMPVDPYWLQTVAEACGEDNLDTLLAQNVFFENMRSVQAGGNTTNTDVRSHDSHMTGSELASESNEPYFVPVDLTQYSNDSGRSEEQKVQDENEDYYYAQRLQEREVMGHSITLYDEQQAREIAERMEKEEVEEVRRKFGKNLDISPAVKEPEPVARDELVAAERAEQERQREAILKRFEEKSREEAELREKLRKTEEERESLNLVIKLQKQEVADGHRAVWKKTRPTESSSEEERIPCQWCGELIPFEKVMLHQQSCQDDYYRRSSFPATRGRGLCLSEDTFRRVENEESWGDEFEDLNIECSYCHVSISASRLATHEAICEANPDINLNKIYETRVLPSATAEHRRNHSPNPAPSVSDGASAKVLSLEKGPCEYCHEAIPLSELIKHETMCSVSYHKPGPAPPPSSPTLLKKTEVPPGEAAASRRGLAIKFPRSDLPDTTTGPSAPVGLESYRRSTPAHSTLEMDNTETKHPSLLLPSEKKLTSLPHSKPVKEVTVKTDLRSTRGVTGASVGGVASLVPQYSPAKMDARTDVAESDGVRGQVRDGRRAEREESSLNRTGRVKAATSNSHSGQRSKPHSTTTSDSRHKHVSHSSGASIGFESYRRTTPAHSSRETKSDKTKGSKYNGNSSVSYASRRLARGDVSTQRGPHVRPKRNYHTNTSGGGSS